MCEYNTGKSWFVAKFLKHLRGIVEGDISEIVWCYGEYQPLYDEIRKSINIPILFNKGLLDLEEFPISKTGKLIVIDDLMTQSNGLVDFFIRGSHHRNLSVIFISQNLFNQGKGKRDISLNAHYIVCFKNPRDRGQIMHFARQVYPENPTFVLEAFSDAVSQPHGYLLFDFKQSTPDEHRLRTNIFPGEACVVYTPIKKSQYKKVSQW